MTVDVRSVADLKKWQKGESDKIQELSNKAITTGKRNVVGVLLAIVVVFVAGLLALQIIKGLIAIIFTVFTGVGLFFGKKYVEHNSPGWQEKFKVQAIEKRIKFVKENAVVFLENIKLERDKRLKEKFEAHTKLGGMLNTLKGKLGTANDAKINQSMQERYDKLTQAHEQGAESLKKMKKSNQEFEEKVEDVKLQQKFSEVADEFTKLSGNAFGDKMQEMLAIEAFTAIEENFNESVAALDANMLKEELDIA